MRTDGAISYVTPYLRNSQIEAKWIFLPTARCFVDFRIGNAWMDVGPSFARTPFHPSGNALFGNAQYSWNKTRLPLSSGGISPCLFNPGIGISWNLHYTSSRT